MGRGSNVAAFAFNLIFIILGMIALVYFFMKNKEQCHRFLSIFFGCYITQIFFLSFLYHMTSSSNEVYNKNPAAGKVVGVIFWIMFVINLSVLGGIGFMLYKDYQIMMMKGSISSFGQLNPNTFGGLKSKNSNILYKSRNG